MSYQTQRIEAVVGAARRGEFRVVVTHPRAGKSTAVRNVGPDAAIAGCVVLDDPFTERRPRDPDLFIRGCKLLAESGMAVVVLTTPNESNVAAVRSCVDAADTVTLLPCPEGHPLWDRQLAAGGEARFRLSYLLDLDSDTGMAA